jgi:NADH-quinone oxidoreductase subunit C
LTVPNTNTVTAEIKPAEAVVPIPNVPSVTITDYALKGYHVDLTFPASRILEAVKLLNQLGFAIDTITGVDWITHEQMEVVYDFFHPAISLRVVVRALIPRSNPRLPTISGLYPGANWHERETSEFYGIHFEGHPNLTPLLLPEDAKFHPLRKDFVA